MKVLITGGAGFIGSHLTDLLLQKNHSVVVIDNLSLGREENIAHNFVNSRFKFYKENVLDTETVSRIFKEELFDAVFHMAANSDIAKSFYNPDVDLNDTFLTTYHILKHMKENNVKSIVFASSSAVYGETDRPIDENYGPLLPVSHYGAGKLASEAFISSFAENYGFEVWIARFPNVVGERATHGVIFDFINKLKKNFMELEVLGDGNQTKPYMYVKDLVEALVFIWENSSDKVNCFNIGVDTATKVSKIAEIVTKEMDVEPKIVYTGGDRGWIGDVPRFNYCLNKINKLGWKAKITSDEAVTKAARYILEQQPVEK